MTTFLQTVAQDLYERLDGHMEHLTIVFPNKRAGMFFSQHLAQLAQRPVWTPRYTTISELFRKMSGLTPDDPIHLIGLLYPIYLKISQRTADEEPLDRFYNWGELMLSDFEDIDNNMARADKLFRNIEELNALNDLDFLSEQQIDAIQTFFENFDPKRQTELKQRFLSVWNLLYPIYEAFRTELRQQGLAYEGMLKRDVAETLPPLPQNGSRQYAFVGFNVLTPTEQALFSHIKKEAEQTFFYWDFDRTYLADNEPVGQFIRDNIQRFGTAIPTDHPCYDNLSAPKSITFVSSATENAQARYAGQWLQSNRKDIEKAPLNQTAVVLCNETLLQPMLHSAPEDMLLNVTMGFPLQQTPVNTLLHLLADFQLHANVKHDNKHPEADTWRTNPVLNLLRHPYTLRMSPQTAPGITKEILKQQTAYATPSLIQKDEFLTLLFQHHEDTGALLDYLKNIVESIGRSYTNASPTDFDKQLYVEAIFNTYTILNRLNDLYKTGLLCITRETLFRLLNRLIKTRSIPFHGEPAVGLQVMGLLETRNLDFRNLIMLSTNEGNLPKPLRNASFIPYNLRAAYGMTTVERQTNLYAYYFYRLLQRAENITLLYNNNTEGTSHNEMSRFMMQLLIRHDIGCGIRQYHLTSPLSTSPASTTELAPYAVSARKQPIGISPSALNTYLNCPLKYYLQYIANLKPEKEITDGVGNDVFGTIFHDCMQDIYTNEFTLKQPIQKQDLCGLAENRKRIADIVDRAFNKHLFHLPTDKLNQTSQYNGLQKLNREVIIKYVQNQLEYDADLCPLTILYVEQDIEKIITLPSGTQIKLNGIIDRVDRITTKDGNEYLRIVDYKTSTKPKEAKNINDLFNPQNSNRAEHILQTFYYADVFTDLIADDSSYTDLAGQAITPALMYVKKTRSSKPSPCIQLKNGNSPIDITDFASQCKQEFHEHLLNTIADIVNPDTPFEQAPATSDACKYCDFLRLCGRTPKKDYK